MMRLKSVLCSLLVVGSLFAQYPKERSALERLKQATLARIEATTKLLSSAKQSALQTLRELNLLTDEIKERQRLIATINNEVRLIDRERSALKQEIADLEKELEGKREKYAEAMRSLYAKKSGVDEFVFVLSADNLSQSYRRMRYLHEYSMWRKEQAQQIMEKQKELTAKRALLEKRRRDQMALLSDRKAEASKLQQKERSQKGLVSSLNKKQSQLKKELQQQQTQARNLDRQIQRIIEEEARKSAQKTSTKPKSKGAYVMDKVEVALSGSFEKNKGKLPYPVNGSYVVVERFGTQKHAQLKYVVTQSNGIELRTKPGTQARSIYDGVVSRVFIVPGYNSSVIIRHGNYLTVYSNLSEVYVKAGDRVKTRELIGKIFSDKANGNMTQMQFQIWKETTKLNPEPWLAK